MRKVFLLAIVLWVWSVVADAQEDVYKRQLRVNAIAPGFFLTDQNRALLTNPDGSLTDRSKTILARCV